MQTARVRAHFSVQTFRQCFVKGAVWVLDWVVIEQPLAWELSERFLSFHLWSQRRAKFIAINNCIILKREVNERRLDHEGTFSYPPRVAGDSIGPSTMSGGMDVLPQEMLQVSRFIIILRMFFCFAYWRYMPSLIHSHVPLKSHAIVFNSSVAEVKSIVVWIVNQFNVLNNTSLFKWLLLWRNISEINCGW